MARFEKIGDYFEEERDELMIKGSSRGERERTFRQASRFAQGSIPNSDTQRVSLRVAKRRGCERERERVDEPR